MKRGIDYIGVGVGAAIFDESGKLLVSLRGHQAKNERGKWQIPGGCIEFGETAEQALKREVREEHGIEIEIIKFFCVHDHIIAGELQHWIALTYICKIIKGVPQNLEPDKCEAIRWVTLDEAAQLPLSSVTKHNVSLLKASNKDDEYEVY